MSSFRRHFVFFALIFFAQALMYAQAEEGEPKVQASRGGYAEVPPAKRPLPVDEQKAAAAAAKDEGADAEENKRNTIMYGIPSEISSLLDDLISEEDPRFTEEIYDLFQSTKSSSIKEKILKYFTELKDPCLEDFAVELLNDPYDEKNSVVSQAFRYVQAVKTTAAAPAVITLIESENESYFNDALATLGDIGGEEEALFVAEYLERDDLSAAQRQTLMRTLGKMQAEATWDKMVEILEDEDENAFVRMYAAESLGLMKTEKSVPILVEQFDATDPNLRQYVIKGLANFPDVVEARSVILQGIRDEHWKVRQESIRTAKELKLSEAVPFLVYRARNDSEKVIKDNSIEALAALNTEEGNSFLKAQLSDKKTGDATKTKIAECLLKEGFDGEKEIAELARGIVTDDKRKSLRYSLGKVLAKYSRDSFAGICAAYLASSDTQTVSLGLDMYKNNKFPSAEGAVRAVAEGKKNGTNKTRAQKLLGIEEAAEDSK